MTRPSPALELGILSIAVLAVLLLDAAVNELHGTAVFYASLIREMVDSGWLSIFQGERAYFLKPPLVLWLSAASAEALGLTNLGVSLVPRLAGVACVLLTYLIAKKLFTHRIAALTVIVLVTNSTFIQFSATLRMDSMLMVGGLLSIYAWLCRDQKFSSCMLFLGLAIGVLSKGPLGFSPILIIVLHSMCFRIPLSNTIRWRWSVLLLPIMCWYGYLFVEHGSAPFMQLGSDLAKPAAASAGSSIEGTIDEYVLKPIRRYLPWLPFMLVGIAIAVVNAMRGEGDEKATMRWLLLWFMVVFISAAAKPDKDIRYLYMGIPVLAIFAGYALDLLAQKFRLRWLTTSLAGLVLVVALVFNLQATDTRAEISALNSVLDKRSDPLVAIGGYPVPPNQPRRQNTHRDWIFFYTGIEPVVLDWTQLNPADIKTGEAYLLTNNRTHAARLAEYGLTAKFVTTEMVYAVRE